MNSLLTSFDFTGGWQDEPEGSPIDLYDYDPRYRFPSAQHTSAGLFHGQNITPTFDGYYGCDNIPQHYGYALEGSSGSNQHISRSLPTYTAAQSYLNHGSTSGQPLNFNRCNSSFSESESDYYHYDHLQQFSVRTQSLPLLPAVWPLSLSEHSQEMFSTTMANTSGAPHLNPSTPTNSSLFYCTDHGRISPPQQDLQPNDPARSQKQTPRFDGDLYTPVYVRGERATREGWCGYCASWHTLKDSAYWYHMHFNHGISCATGQRLPAPKELRTTLGTGRGVDDCDALCGGCGRWQLLVAGERGRTAWFRHAYKCQLKGSVSARPSGRSRARSERGKSRSPKKVAAKLAR